MVSEIQPSSRSLVTASQGTVVSREEKGILSHSRFLIKDALETPGSALNDTAEGRKKIQELNRLMTASITSILNAQERFDQSSRKFSADCALVDENITKQGTTLMSLVGQLNQDAEAISARFAILMNMAKSWKSIYRNTTEQALDLEQGYISKKLKDNEDVKVKLEILFFARLKELDLLTERLKIINVQEDHQLTIKTALQAQQLKEEEAYFDKLMKKAQFNSDQDQQKFNQGLAEREQRRKETSDMKDYELKKLKIVKDSDLETLKVENQKETDIARIEADKYMQDARLDSDYRKHVLDAASDVFDPCCIM